MLIFSQGRTSKGTVSGTVVDADDKMPVMQATVQVLSPKDSTMITLERDITNSGYTKSIINGKEYDFKMNPDIERTIIIKTDVGEFENVDFK